MWKGAQTTVLWIKVILFSHCTGWRITLASMNQWWSSSNTSTRLDFATPTHWHYHLMSAILGDVQAITREKMLASLERDRAVSEVHVTVCETAFTVWHVTITCFQVTYLQSTLQSVQQANGAPLNGGKPHPSKNDKTTKTMAKVWGSCPALVYCSWKSDSKTSGNFHPSQYSIAILPLISLQTCYEFPGDPVNPHRSSRDLPVCAHLSRTGGLQPSASIKAHHYAINCIALHPTKEILVTASDDHTWKMWAFPRYVHVCVCCDFTHMP